MKVIRLLVVDDDQFFLTGLIAELEAMVGVEVVGAAANIAEVLRYNGGVDVVLLDLGLPGSCRRTATADVLHRWPDTHVLVVTAYATGPDVVQAFAEGARGYATKNIRPWDLREAIETVAAGRSYCTPMLAGHLLNFALKLSPAERAVLRHVAEGLADKQVAATLGISEKAVENRLASVRLKAGLLDRSRSSITRFAMDADPFCQLTATEHLEDDRRRRRIHRIVPDRAHEDRSRSGGLEPIGEDDDGVPSKGVGS